MASMTNCTHSWPMHLFWRCVCAIRQVAQSHASWMQLNKMLGALLCLCVSIWGSWRLSTIYQIYEDSPTYIFLFVTSRWKLLTELTNTDLGVANLHDFPGTESFPLTPEQQWPSDCHQLAHIYPSQSRSTIKVNTLYTLDQVPEGRPPALHCSFQAAPEDNC